MATVFLAHDLRHDRPVALKVLKPELAHALGAGRFLREIRTAARLQHPHILSVYDSGETAGRLWFTMPYVEGESLRDRLKREKQLPINDALSIACTTARALHYAHTHGVVHRDIKPENLLLTEDGNTLVADFGVARALTPGEAQLTETGLAVGTPQYMAPEQAAGGVVDPRTDVYALGCVLYEMLAGEAPYTGPTPQAILAKRVLEPVPHVRTLRESVPEMLERSLMKALAKAPADRFQTADELARALAGLSADASQVTPATTPAIPLVTLVSATAHSRRRVPVAAVTLGLGFLIGLGVLFGWLRSHGRESAAEGKVLAVLPFENQGAPQDEYFADGVTDAVRGKLAALPAVQVIAKASSAPYKKTSKTPQQIARELGARYLLTGTVRWERGTGGASRVLVSPELVEVPTTGSPKTRWQQPFDAALTDVFQVQSQISSQVAQALDVALGATERERLGVRPTTNPVAYDYYLRANVFGERGVAEADVRAAEEFYEKAVALDSSFALAYAALSRTHDAMYWFYHDHTEARIERARSAAERALRLQPDLAEGHLALGFYYYHRQLDYARALQELSEARRLQPSNGDVYSSMGAVHRRQGRWVEAAADFKKAIELNPRSAGVLTELAVTQIWLRTYPDAEQSVVRALEISPTEGRAQWLKAFLYVVWRGDTLAGQRVLRAALAEAGPERILPGLLTFVSFYTPQSLVHAVYDTALTGVSISTFGNDTVGYYTFEAGLHARQRHADRARAFLDSARVVLEAHTARQPDDPRFHALLGTAYAELGRAVEARREAERATALRPISHDAVDGVLYRLNWARVLAKTGQSEAALDHLAYLLSIPATLSAMSLRVDHIWDALRSNPRFQRLMNGT
jgi:serine/threonine-protein kinase